MTFDVWETKNDRHQYTTLDSTEEVEMANSQSEPGSSTVTNLGQISVMKLPDGFEIGRQSDETIGTKMFKEYHSDDDPEVQFTFYYRGMRTRPDSAKAFHELLEAPPHVLKQSEFDKISETLYMMAHPEKFKLMIAKTQDINGKRVLSVEGEFVHDGSMIRTLFIDSDGTGSAVQEISFRAPKDRYMKNIPRASKVFDSINWI